MHCVVYRQRPDVFAIIHSEPIYVNTLGALGKRIEPVVACLLTNLGGPVPVMPHLWSGSEHFGNEMMKVLYVCRKGKPPLVQAAEQREVLCFKLTNYENPTSDR